MVMVFQLMMKQTPTNNTACMRRRPTSAVWLLFFCFLSSTRADDKPCTGRNAGKYYDLNPLQAAKDYTLTSPGGNEMVLSACKSVSHETWGLKVQDPGLVGGFVRRGHGDFSMGQTNTTLSFSGRAGHPHLTLAGGSKCFDSNGNTIENLRGSTEIEFICDPSSNLGSPRLVAQLPPGNDDDACAWFFEWRTATACPTSEGFTFWGFTRFLLISIFVLLVSYLVLGTVYNYFVLHLTGVDAIPRFTVSSMVYHVREAWDLAKDWWAESRATGKFNFSSSAGTRGPVGIGDFPSFSSNGGRPDLERDDSESSFSRGRGGAGNGHANPSIRTSVRKEHVPQGSLNPASHQAQTMAGTPSPSAPSPAAASTTPVNAVGIGGGNLGLNPASHQAQVLAASGPRMEAVEPTTTGVGLAGGLNPASHQAQLMAGMPVPQLAQAQQNPAPPGGQAFSVGDDEDGEGDV